MKHLLFLCLFLPLLAGCGAGDDDGRRLGDYIVGTWLRGWGEGDVIIEGATDLRPDNFTYATFVFDGDGTYNGMMRSGSFHTYDTDGELLFEGSYQCDNSTLKMEYVNDGRQTILAKILTFTEDTMVIQYKNEDYNVMVTVTLRKSVQ